MYENILMFLGFIFMLFFIGLNLYYYRQTKLKTNLTLSILIGILTICYLIIWIHPDLDLI